MAYKKRASMKKRSSRKRVSKGKMRVPSHTERKRHALTTDYAKALLDPINGPLVGVPQFVPIDTHRVRVKALGTVSTSTGALNVFFNPVRMGSRDSGPVRYGTENTTGSLTEAANMNTVESNAEYSTADYQVTGVGETINNGDGVRSRVVSALFRVTNVSSDNVRDGVFHALHENHHKTLEDMTLSQISTQSNSIVVSAADGKAVSLLYRPVKPAEVDDWQKSAWHLPGETAVYNAEALDGTMVDAMPGYMNIRWRGSAGSAGSPISQTFLIEAYAIIEYVGESVTTLAKPIGGRVAAAPADVPMASDAAASVEQSQGTVMDHDSVDAARVSLGTVAANTAKGIQATAIVTDVATHVENIADHVDARLLEAGKVAVYGGNAGHVEDALVAQAPKYLKASLEDYRVTQVSESGRYTAFLNPTTRDVVITAAGTPSVGGTVAAHDVVSNSRIVTGTFSRDEKVLELGRFIRRVHVDNMEQGFTIAPRLVGHSQGGSAAIAAAEKGLYTVPIKSVTAFNPGVGLDTPLTRNLSVPTRVVRTHTDFTSMLSNAVKRPGPNIAPAAKRQMTEFVDVGLKLNTSAKDGLMGGHQLKQFLHTDAEVTALGGGKVAVTRMGKVASTAKVLGPLLAVAGSAYETGQDIKHFQGSKSDKAAVGVADVGLAAGEFGAIAAAGAVGGPLGMAAAVVADIAMHSALKKEAQKDVIKVKNFIGRGIKKLGRYTKRQAI